jgi:hypothetical protein
MGRITAQDQLDQEFMRLPSQPTKMPGDLQNTTDETWPMRFVLVQSFELMSKKTGKDLEGASYGKQG